MIINNDMKSNLDINMCSKFMYKKTLHISQFATVHSVLLHTILGPDYFTNPIIKIFFVSLIVIPTYIQQADQIIIV